jgi:NAD(P)-dependent dehydrogenase (short-subunit alcohol dehydrogenase family)
MPGTIGFHRGPLSGISGITTSRLRCVLRPRATGARIINVSSGTGSLHWQTDPQHYFAGMGASAGYPVSKAALNMLTVQYAKALAGDRIAVNAVAPGACRTDFTTELGLLPERTAAQGAAIAVHLATTDQSPTAGFFHDDGTVPW